jgi:surfeit locus 1 family protein
VSNVGALQRIGLSLVALGLVAAMVMLGLWQLGVYDDKQSADAHRREKLSPVALDSVLGRDQAFDGDHTGRPVHVTGHWAAARQLWVARGIAPDGTYAVTTPLVTTNGSAILVVRGVVDRVGAGASVPAGSVSVQGILEPPTNDGTAPTADGIVDGLRTGALVEAFPMDLYDGFVVLTTSEPASVLPTVVPPVPSASRWAGLRNLVYAVQWWMFAAFVVFMAWRMMAERSAPPDSAPVESQAADSTSVGTGSAGPDLRASICEPGSGGSDP